jgi:hypothetical protein
VLELLQVLFDFLFDPRGVDLGEHPAGRFVFAVASAILGILIVGCDWALTVIRPGKPSLLGLKYLHWHWSVVVMLWGFGSGAIGFVAVALGLMQLTIQSCITIGISWTILFPKILSREFRQVQVGEGPIPTESHEESEEENES